MTQTLSHAPLPIDYDNLGPMVEGYVECALWSSHYIDFMGDEQNFDKFTVRDIGVPYLRQMIRDCVVFYWRNRNILETLYWGETYTESQCGYDFWLSRNGHGEGFFDRGLGKFGDVLQYSAENQFSPVDLCVNDEGQVVTDIHPEYGWGLHTIKIGGPNV